MGDSMVTLDTQENRRDSLAQMEFVRDLRDLVDRYQTSLGRSFVATALESEARIQRSIGQRN